MRSLEAIGAVMEACAVRDDNAAAAGALLALA
jgi:hypothetical protein